MKRLFSDSHHHPKEDAYLSSPMSLDPTLVLLVPAANEVEH
jgi:hemerythrin-like domain-containing protein